MRQPYLLSSYFSGSFTNETTKIEQYIYFIYKLQSNSDIIQFKKTKKSLENNKNTISYNIIIHYIINYELGGFIIQQLTSLLLTILSVCTYYNLKIIYQCYFY